MARNSWQSPVNPDDAFLIVDTSTGKPLESWPTQRQADHFCACGNAHEARCGRPEVFEVQQVRPV